MTVLRQIWIVSALNFRNLRGRAWQSLVIVVGMACVSGVLLSMLSLTDGLYLANLDRGDPRAVIVVSHNSTGSGGSSIPRDQARIIMSVPGIAKAADGTPIADATFFTGTPVLLKKNGATAYMQINTFGKMGAAFQPGFHLVAGRMFHPGSQELIVGTMARSKFKGMNVGDKVTLPNGQWPIVGMFATGELLDGALVGDTETIMQAMRHNTYNIVMVRLESPAAFAPFQSALNKNPLLSVDVWRVPEWNARTSAQTEAFFHVLIYGVSAILAIGALFGCFNTMYAAVDMRRREIATLRALGYGSFAVAFSVVAEAAALAMGGALIGAAIAWSLYSGVEGDMGSSFFKLVVSPAMVGMALLWGLAVAVLGALLPSVRAARSMVADALRAR